MERSRKVIYVAHCIFNQNSVVHPLARAKGGFGFVQQLVREGIGMEQLPCPEFKFLGLARPSRSVEEYDISAYREFCRALAVPYVEDMLEYLRNGYELCGLIGIHQSPSCSISVPTGIFMQELLSLMEAHNISLKYIEVPERYDDADAEDFFCQMKVCLGL